jgi:hypothetical protein
MATGITTVINIDITNRKAHTPLFERMAFFITKNVITDITMRAKRAILFPALSRALSAAVQPCHPARVVSGFIA